MTNEQDTELTFEEREILDKMLRELEMKNKSAQDIIDSVGRR